MEPNEFKSLVNQSLRFRVQDEKQWRSGRIVHISNAGMQFSSLEQVELGTVLEVDLDSWETARSGKVVKRILMSWPELTTQVAISFLEHLSTHQSTDSPHNVV